MGDNCDAAADCKDEFCDPQAWLTQTLERLANGWPSSEIPTLCRGATTPERPQLAAYGETGVLH